MLLLEQLRHRGNEVVAQVLARNRTALSSLSREDRRRVESLAHAVACRLLDEPEARLEAGAGRYAEALRELFALD
jgi:glutamyl-tRNA reductase